VAVAGQLVSLLGVHYSLGFPLPLVPALGAIGASVLLNLVLSLDRHHGIRLSDNAAALLLGYDIVQLSALLAVTGGLHNPFAVLFVVPVTVAATVLSLRATMALSGLAIACISLVALYHWPLPWKGGPPDLPPLYLSAVWVALVLGTVFMASYAWRIAAEARRMADALGATQLALAREQRVSALGALAAAAAHELGTPLSTIAVVAKELARELPEGTPAAADAQLVLEQAGRCRALLGKLSALSQGEVDSPFGHQPISGLVESAAGPYRRPGVVIEVVRMGAPGVAEPSLPRRAEILHGLANFIENASEFCRERIIISVRWDGRMVKLTILDDGLGFSPIVLAELGEPYVSTRREAGRLGLGVFIAKTLLERTGASVSFANQRPGGAEITIGWSDKALNVLAVEPTGMAKSNGADQARRGSA
jgi:two-component system sensor histidine kinase RegB